MPDVGIFLARIWKNVAIFKISTLEFVQSQNFPEKQKCLFGYFWPEMPYLGIFGQEF